MSNKVKLGNGLIDLKAIIKECDRIRVINSNLLSHNDIGKGIGYYSNGEKTYQTININNSTGLNILKVIFTPNVCRIEMDKDYINRRSLGAIHKRLKAIV